MKKVAVLFFALAVLALPSCKNQNKQAEADADNKEVSVKETYVTEELKLNLQKLLEDSKEMKNTAFIKKSEGGAFSLSDEEKMVKPDYLLAANAADNLVTLAQKYRILTMLGVDKTVADLYEMPLDEYDAAISKLVVDVNDPALKAFTDVDVNDAEAVKTAVNAFVAAEYEACRANFVWEAVAAGLVEQLYVLTQNINKFMPMFDDQAVTDLTFDFICIHEGIMSLQEFYPEMESLNTVLLPLYVINAISVDQFKSQLLELKDDIAAARAALLQ